MTHTVDSQRGVTLIELIIFIIVVSVAMTGVLVVMNQSSRTNADPMLREQATAIAQAYMEEVMLQPYSDPDGGETGSCELGETRSTYDDVADYDCTADNNGAVDQNGTVVPGLEAYNVLVNVMNDTLNGDSSRRIDIQVSHDGVAGMAIMLTAHRLDYP